MQTLYREGETANKTPGYIKFLKQPDFCFIYFHSLVAVLQPVSLKFQQDKLLVSEIPSMVSKATNQIQALLVTQSKNLDCLMFRLKLYPECSFDFLFKDVILDKLENGEG